jgi:hypothetical protein
MGTDGKREERDKLRGERKEGREKVREVYYL